MKQSKNIRENGKIQNTHNDEKIVPSDEKLTEQIKNLPWKLYLSVFLIQLLPTIYQTVRIYFLGNLPGAYGVNIASQLVWIGLLLEVIQEGLILPLFYIMGKTIKDRQQTINKVKSGLIITLGIHTLLLLILGIFTRQFSDAMAQNPELIDATVEYIRYELIALLFQASYKYMFVLFIVRDSRKILYRLLLFQMSSTILLDIFFLSELSISLQLGVNGIAFSNIITYVILSVISIKSAVVEFSLKKEEWNAPLNYSWLKEWGKVGGYSGLDSFIRNLFYMVFIIRMMNVLSEQGTYWIANGFIWGWLLLPMYPLSDVVKQSIATKSLNENPSQQIRKIMRPFYWICTILIIIWFITMPGWPIFIQKVLNVEDYKKVYHLILLLLPAYISFVYNTIADSVFYALGKTEALAIQTILTNISVYGIAFILFKQGIFIPSLTSIALLFSLGIVVDGILTYVLLRMLLNKCR